MSAELQMKDAGSLLTYDWRGNDMAELTSGQATCSGHIEA